MGDILDYSVTNGKIAINKLWHNCIFVVVYQPFLLHYLKKRFFFLFLSKKGSMFISGIRVFLIQYEWYFQKLCFFFLSSC